MKKGSCFFSTTPTLSARRSVLLSAKDSFSRAGAETLLPKWAEDFLLPTPSSVLTCLFTVLDFLSSPTSPENNLLRIKSQNMNDQPQVLRSYIRNGQLATGKFGIWVRLWEIRVQTTQVRLSFYHCQHLPPLYWLNQVIRSAG